WSGQLGAVPPAAFAGPSATVALDLDLTRIAVLEKSFYNETGIALGTTDIVVRPTVHVRGFVDGVPVDDSFAPSLSFHVSGGVLTPTSGSATGAAPVSLSAQRTGAVTRATPETATMSILGRGIGVGTARAIGLTGTVVAGTLCVAGWSWVARRRQMDETERIRAAYGHDLVPVSASPAAAARLVVEVGRFSALARLARRYDCMILALEHPGGHAYYVECGATVYRCGVEPGGRPSLVALAAPPSDLTYHVSSLPSAS
ncbi:MAG TPA: hypothetical protein VEI83_01895, partial [Acidimicrobiales bacterium]|nr:hypothetical protein [Acidimicrobiales bacterium]